MEKINSPYNHHIINVLRELKKEGVDLNCKNESGEFDQRSFWKTWYSILSGEKAPKQITAKMIHKILDTIVYDLPYKRGEKSLDELRRGLIGFLNQARGSGNAREDVNVTRDVLRMFSRRIQEQFRKNNLLFPTTDNIKAIFEAALNKEDLFEIIHLHLDDLPTLLKIRFINETLKYIKQKFKDPSLDKFTKRRLFHKLEELKSRVLNKQSWFDELGELIDDYYLLIKQQEVSKKEHSKKSASPERKDFLFSNLQRIKKILSKQEYKVLHNFLSNNRSIPKAKLEELLDTIASIKNSNDKLSGIEVKRLQGFEDKYRIRIYGGNIEYRIIYQTIKNKKGNLTRRLVFIGSREEAEKFYRNK